MLTVTLATIALSVYLYIIIPKGFFPQQDQGRINGTIVADQATSFQAMESRAERLVNLVLSDPAVDNLNAQVGGQGGGGGNINTGTMNITLKNLKERKMSTDQVIARLRPKLLSVPGISLYLQAVQDLRIGGRNSGAQYRVHAAVG